MAPEHQLALALALELTFAFVIEVGLKPTYLVMFRRVRKKVLAFINNIFPVQFVSLTEYVNKFISCPK